VPDRLEGGEDELGVVLARLMTGGHVGVHMSSMESWLELGVERSGCSDKERAHEAVGSCGGDLTMADGRSKNFSRSICFPEFRRQFLSGESGLTTGTSQSSVMVSFASVIWW
jgi:hypothetical protein